MARTQAPTGDSIAEQIKSRPADQADFSDIVKSLTDAHDHRPGLFQQDLGKVNDALHAKGLLPQVDIVSVNGQDLVGKKSDGTYVEYDATNLSRSKDITAPVGSAQINGRDATQNADGSGTVTAKAGDNPWTLGADILKSQGINNPTDRQIANLYKELKKHNSPESLKHMKPGDQINYASAFVAGDTTQFSSDRNNDQVQKDKADLQANVDAAKIAIKNFGGNDQTWIVGKGPYITADQVSDALQKPGITDQERKGLQFIQKNYDQVFANNSFHASDLDNYQAKLNGLMDMQLTQDNYVDAKNN